MPSACLPGMHERCLCACFASSCGDAAEPSGASGDAAAAALAGPAVPKRVKKLQRMFLDMEAELRWAACCLWCHMKPSTPNKPATRSQDKSLCACSERRNRAEASGVPSAEMFAAEHACPPHALYMPGQAAEPGLTLCHLDVQ